MKQEERRKVENRLIAMGLDSIDDPELGAVFAAIVEDFPGDKHWFFRGMLNECNPAFRREMYECIKPRFRKFSPKSLETYLIEIAEEAGAKVARRQMRVEGRPADPIVVGGREYMEVASEVATHAIVTLKCYKCGFSEQFVSSTPVSAMYQARLMKWVREPGVNKETCPTCNGVVN